MKAYAGMDQRLPLRDVPAYARRIEAMGFDVLDAVYESFRSGVPPRAEGDVYSVTRLQPYFNPDRNPSARRRPRGWAGCASWRGSGPSGS